MLKSRHLYMIYLTLYIYIYDLIYFIRVQTVKENKLKSLDGDFEITLHLNNKYERLFYSL